MSGKRLVFYVAAWAVGMMALAAMAWNFERELSSWQFFGTFAILFTAFPVIAWLIIRGVESE